MIPKSNNNQSYGKKHIKTCEHKNTVQVGTQTTVEVWCVDCGECVKSTKTEYQYHPHLAPIRHCANKQQWLYMCLKRQYKPEIYHNTVARWQ
jgi:hypothetical protein